MYAGSKARQLWGSSYYSTSPASVETAVCGTVVILCCSFSLTELTFILFCFMQVSFRKDPYLLPVHLIDFSWSVYHWLQKGPFSRFPDGYNPIAHCRVWVLEISLLGNSSAWETFAHFMTSDWILRNIEYHKTVPLKMQYSYIF